MPGNKWCNALVTRMNDCMTRMLIWLIDDSDKEGKVSPVSSAPEE